MFYTKTAYTTYRIALVLGIRIRCCCFVCMLCSTYGLASARVFARFTFCFIPHRFVITLHSLFRSHLLLAISSDFVAVHGCRFFPASLELVLFAALCSLKLLLHRQRCLTSSSINVRAPVIKFYYNANITANKLVFFLLIIDYLCEGFFLFSTF